MHAGALKLETWTVKLYIATIAFSLTHRRPSERPSQCVWEDPTARPRGKKSKTFQLELHYRATQESNKFSVILNNMKVMCIFDWILSIRDFLMESPDDPFKQGLTSLYFLAIFSNLKQFLG